MTNAYSEYRAIADDVNAIDRQIMQLSQEKRAKVRDLSNALDALLRDRNLLSDILWSFEGFEDDYIVLRANNDVETHKLLHFLEPPRNAEYQLSWSDDYDRVLTSLVIRTIGQRTVVRLEFHAEYAHIGIVTYDLNVNQEKLNREINSLSEKKSRLDMIRYVLSLSDADDINKEA